MRDCTDAIFTSAPMKSSGVPRERPIAYFVSVVPYLSLHHSLSLWHLYEMVLKYCSSAQFSYLSLLSSNFKWDF
jgi:hypothetical protein